MINEYVAMENGYAGIYLCYVAIVGLILLCTLQIYVTLFFVLHYLWKQSG